MVLSSVNVDGDGGVTFAVSSEMPTELVPIRNQTSVTTIPNNIVAITDKTTLPNREIFRVSIWRMS